MFVSISATAWLAARQGAGPGFKAAYDEAFRASFRTRSIAGSVTAASKATAAGIDVTPLCTCVTDRMLATKTVEQLTLTPSADDVRILSTECMKAHYPVAGRAEH